MIKQDLGYFFFLILSFPLFSKYDNSKIQEVLGWSLSGFHTLGGKTALSPQDYESIISISWQQLLLCQVQWPESNPGHIHKCVVVLGLQLFGKNGDENCFEEPIEQKRPHVRRVLWKKWGKWRIGIFLSFFATTYGQRHMTLARNQSR